MSLGMSYGWLKQMFYEQPAIQPQEVGRAHNPGYMPVPPDADDVHEVDGVESNNDSRDDESEDEKEAVAGNGERDLMEQKQQPQLP